MRQAKQEEEDVPYAVEAEEIIQDAIAVSSTSRQEFFLPKVDLRDFLMRFYEEHAKSKLDEVDGILGILGHFKNREMDLCRTLETKFSVKIFPDGTWVKDGSSSVSLADSEALLAKLRKEQADLIAASSPVHYKQQRESGCTIG